MIHTNYQDLGYSKQKAPEKYRNQYNLEAAKAYPVLAQISTLTRIWVQPERNHP